LNLFSAPTLARKLRGCLLLASATLIAQTAAAGLAESGTWSGRYQDAQGGQLVVLQSGSSLEVHGYDKGSMFHLVCAVGGTKGDAAECVGSGINHEGAPGRFVYRSQWKRTADGGFNEEWQAVFGERTLSGKASFKRMAVGR
jgi:hypothetical protein